MKMIPAKLKVLCVGEDDKSYTPMFAALLARAIHQDGNNSVEVESAGIKCTVPGNSADKEAVDCMADLGIDLQSHQCRSVVVLNLASYDVIVCIGNMVTGFIHNHVRSPRTIIKTIHLGQGVTLELSGKPYLAYRLAVPNIKRCATFTAKGVIRALE